MIKATNPANTDVITLNRSLSIIEMKKALREMNAKIPEQIVRKRDTPNPMHLTAILSRLFITMILH
jgi:hypothetical protein